MALKIYEELVDKLLELEVNNEYIEVEIEEDCDSVSFVASIDEVNIYSIIVEFYRDEQGNYINSATVLITLLHDDDLFINMSESLARTNECNINYNGLSFFVVDGYAGVKDNEQYNNIDDVVEFMFMLLGVANEELPNNICIVGELN